MSTRTDTPDGDPARPAVFFAGPEQFRSWLHANHDTATELWMGLYRKGAPNRGLTWEQAVPEALCYGWIDSVSQRIDDNARRQRWSPRRPNGNWSAINIALVEKLIAEGRMQPSGLAAFERRLADRSAIYSYERDGMPALSPEFQARLDADAGAAAWFAVAPASYRKIAIGWVMSAKREATRDSRMAMLLDDSAHGRLIKSQRYGAEPAWVARNRWDLGIE